MNLGFPTRFLNKLDIYQQIRNGQGISKHKNLWKYEKAFLQTAYEGDHQFLGENLNREMIEEWIKKIDVDYDGDARDQIIGNLCWRGYLNKNEDDKYNVSVQGILVGETISEIYNKNCVIRFWNRYRYDFILDVMWLVIFILLSTFFYQFLPSENKEFMKDFLKLDSWVAVTFLVFILWPTLNWLYRSSYQKLEQ